MKRCLEFLLVVVAMSLASPLFAQRTDVPEIPADAVSLVKMPPNMYLGETVGVTSNSKGHVFVFSRERETRLFEFDQNGTFVREIGDDLYGFAFAHAVRVDAQDNLWAIDEGTNMIMKFDPEGRVIMLMGRRPESSEGMLATPVFTPGQAPQIPPAQPYFFNRPTDIAWDAAGNNYVSDGYNNSRVVKYDKNGVFIKSIGVRGAEPGQFNTPHGIATDNKGNVYVADRGNDRIQVFDSNLVLRAIWPSAVVGDPWTLCITPGQTQYIYESDSVAGQVYKMDLNGKVLGKFGTAGHQLKQFAFIHEISCNGGENEVLTGELENWRVQKITLHPGTQVSTNSK